MSMMFRSTTATPARRIMPADAAEGSAAVGSLGVGDPRWVFAVQVRQRMVGPLLRPGDRRALCRMGVVLGLREFDCHLIIALVQDRARRGEGLDDAAGALAAMPLPDHGERRRAMWRVAWISATALVVEACVLWAAWWWAGVG